MIVLRTLAALAGLGILAAVAHVTILGSGGYGFDTNAPLIVALSGGVAIGAPIAALGSRGLAVFLIAALIAGELYAFIATANWHVAHLEAQAAPVHEAEAKRKAAEARVARLERDDRVERAERALAGAREDANAQSTAKHCNKGCIATLSKTVDDATAAVAQARESLQLDQRQARAALADAPLPPSASPLADRLGLPAWKLDLIAAGLRSFACTVLAGALLAFAAHGRREPAPQAPVPLPRNVVSITAKRAALPVKIGDVDAFLLDRVKHEEGARVSWAEAFIAYRAWCDASGCTPVEAGVFGARLDTLRAELGLRVRTKGQDVFFVDLKLAS